MCDVRTAGTNPCCPCCRFGDEGGRCDIPPLKNENDFQGLRLASDVIATSAAGAAQCHSRYFFFFFGTTLAPSSALAGSQLDLLVNINASDVELNYLEAS